MNRTRNQLAFSSVLWVACAAFLMAGCAAAPPSTPTVDGGPTTQALKKLPRKPGERVVVTVYQFRSVLLNVSSVAATDMFKTALVQSGQFRVVERARLAEGALREKQMNQDGMTTGTAGRGALRGAQYVFEGTVSEANASEQQRSGGVSVGGMQITGGSNKDSLAIDVRIVDVRTGDILDVVTVRKTIKSDSQGVSGVGNLLGTVLAQKGRSSPYTPDIDVQQQQREGVDAALREAINQAVLELSQRFAH
jgi:curli biogenesis system outer membrane secretion channel CsgG